MDAVHDGGSVFVDFTPSPCQEVQNVIWYYAVDSATGQRAHCYENPGTNVEAAKSDCAMGFTIPVTTCQKGAQDTVTVYGYNANGPGASTQSMPFPLLPATSCVVPNP